MPRNGHQSTYYTYPIELSVQYETLGAHAVIGVGRTISISSEAIRFVCADALPAEGKVRLVLAWPAKLPDGAALNLWVVGTVARSDGNEVEVRVVSYEFRTRRSVKQPVAAQRRVEATLAPAAGLFTFAARS